MTRTKITGRRSTALVMVVKAADLRNFNDLAEAHRLDRPRLRSVFFKR